MTVARVLQTVAGRMVFAQPRADVSDAEHDRFADAVIVAAGASTRMGGVDKMAEPLARTPAARLVGRGDGGARNRSLGSSWWRDRSASTSSRRALAEAPARRSSPAASAAPTRSGPASRPRQRRWCSSMTGRARLRRAARRQRRAAAAEHGAAVPVLPVVDSLKRDAAPTLGASIERDGLVRTQTPQGARRELLLDAFAAAGREALHGRGGAARERRRHGRTVPGEPANLKVTDRPISRSSAPSRRQAGRTGP